MKRIRLLFPAAIFASAGLLSSQSSAQQPPAQSGTIQINVNLVQLDAVVTDGKGKPVTDLTLNDFELLQDGKVQKLRNTEFVRLNGPVPVPVSPATRTAAGKLAANLPNALLMPAAPLKADGIRRTISLVVDDIALSFNGVVYVRDALRQWVENDMKPGDMVSVVRTNAAMGALQQFTNDKRILLAAIDRINYQPGRVGVESFNPIQEALMTIVDGPNSEHILGGTYATTFDGELSNEYLLGSFSAIRYVIQGLRDLPGRKSLVLFTEDLSLRKLDTQRQSIEDRLRRLVDEANRSSVVIYVIDPRGSSGGSLSVSDNLHGYEQTEMIAKINDRFDQFNASQDGMITLSARTGGLFYTGENDLSIPLSKAVNDGDGYYVLGYTPEGTTFETKASTPDYHKISVRVKRPGLKVRSREGFLGMADAINYVPTIEDEPTQIAKALVSPFGAPDLRIRLTTLFTNSAAEGSQIETLLYFDAHDLKFVEQADGSRNADVDIALMTFDQDGNPAERVHKTWNVKVAKESYPELLNRGLVYKAFVPVRHSGPYQLRVAVRDASSQKLGSAMQFVEVPDVKGGQMALSGIVMKAKSTVDDNAYGSPAVRIFAPGAGIDYAYQVMNAKQVNGQPQLQTLLRVFRDGRIVYERPWTPVAGAVQDVSKALVVDGQLNLLSYLPGDYVLQVVVSENSQKDKVRLAAQSIDFEVRRN